MSAPEGTAGRARRREPSDLYATILEVVKRHHGRARVTRISYGAGMPVDRLRRALGRLERAGLVRREEPDGHPCFDITPRGQEFLDTYWRMRAHMEVLEAPLPPAWSADAGPRPASSARVSCTEGPTDRPRTTTRRSPR
ncbi:MAG: winged helix-turn-helix domain-containing protein [Thermoplasmata archaeon]